MNKKAIIIISLIVLMFLCISAVSAENATQYYVDSSVSESGDGSQDSPFKTIEEAVNVVNENETTEIYVNEGTYKPQSTITLDFNHNQTSLSIIGIGNPVLDTSIALFKVSNGNISFLNFVFKSSAGASKQILSQSGGSVTFDTCNFNGIGAPGDGKGLFSGENGYLNIINSKFSNLKNKNQLIVLKNYQHVTVVNSQFSNGGRIIYSNINSAKKGGYIDIVNSSFSGCYYPIRLTVNILNISGSTFSGCRGNVIFHSPDDKFKKTEIYIDNSKFTSNSYDGTEDVDSEFKNVESAAGAGDHYGGAIYSQAKVLNVTNSLFKDNSMAQGESILSMSFLGAGIYASNINCVNTTFYGNSISGGGFKKEGSAIYVTDSAYIFNSTFINNRLPFDDGGAIYAKSKLDVNNCLFSNNKGEKDYCSIVFSGTSNINNNVFLDLGKVVSNKTSNFNLDYNWWNTNERPNFLANNWIILDLESEVDDLVSGSDVVFTLNFKNIKYANGTICKYDNTMSERLLKAVFDSGTIHEFNSTSYEVKSLNANFTYTPEGNIGDLVVVNVYSDNNLILTKEYILTEPFITVQAEDILAGENAIIIVSIFSPQANGTVTLKIDDKTYTNESNNNKAIFNISGLGGGIYEITAQYEGMQATSNLTVTKVNTTAEINVNGDIGAGNPVTLEIVLAPDATGIIEIKVNDIEDIIPVNYGIATYTINSLLPVDYAINITYSGDKKYNPVKNSTMLHVVKGEVSLNVNANDIYFGDDLVVNVAFNESDVDGSVKIKLNDIEMGTAIISNGTATFTIKNPDAGNYTVCIIYDGGNKYSGAQANRSVNVYQQNSTFDVSISQNPDNSIRLVVDINATGNVTFIVGNVEKTVDIVDNQAVLDNINLNDANYIAEITYNGDKNYHPSTSEFNFAIKNHKLLIRYYVDGIVKKSGDGTRTNPFKTINEAVDHVVDDYAIEIYILPDEYSINSKITLELNHKAKGTTLSFIGWGGDTPIINCVSGYDAVNTFRIGQNSNVFFKNLEFVEPGDRYFYIDGGNVTFNDCILENAKTETLKSTIYLTGGNLVLDSTTVRDCDYSGDIGGFIHIATKSSNVLINNSKFSYNLGTEASVIYTMGTAQNTVFNVTVINSVFKGNTNALKVASVTTVDNCTFENNQGKFIIFSSKISNYGDNNNLTVINSKFNGNTAAHLVESAGDVLYIENSAFNNNNGNGLVYAHNSLQDQSQFIVSPKVYVYDSLFEHNNVGTGAIYSYVGLENVSSSRFVSNSGLKGAAIFAYENVNVYNSTFISNSITSDKDGAAIYIERGNDVNISYSSFKNNKALDVNNAITVSSVSGKTVINDNAFYNNDGFDVYNKGISEINADSNWWGSNDNPNLNINVSNWVILTATSTPDFNNTTLNVNFNKLRTAENETIDYTSSIPDREVRLASDDGDFVGGYYGGYVFTGTNGDVLFIPDEHNFTVDIYVDDKYITTLNGALKVKTVPEIIIDVNDTPLGSPVIIVITVVDATGNVTVSVADFTDTLVLNNSVASLTISGLSVNDYQVKVCYGGDYNYLEANETEDFSVVKLNTTMDLSFDGESLTVKLLNGTTGTVDVNAEVRNYSSRIKNGTAIIDITSLGNGNYTLFVSYGGDDNYNPVNGTIDVEIILNTTKVTPEILIDVNDTPLGSPVSIVITVVNATGNVTISIRDYEDTVDLIDSVASLNVTGLSVNDYKLKVLYNGDDNYLVNDKTVEFSVLKLNATMDISFDGDNVIVKLPQDATGVVNVSSNDIIFQSNVSDGNAIINVSSLADGNYTLSVFYSGDDNYNSARDSIAIEIKPKVILKAYDLVKYYHDSNVFKAYLGYDNGSALGNKEVIVNINGRNYTKTTGSDGIVTLGINLGSRNYTAKVFYNDNGTLITSSATIQVLPTVLASDLTKMYRNGSQFYAKVLDSNGNPLPKGSEVTFNINGVMYKRQTDENGVARLDINLINRTYIITTINPFNGEMASNTVKVLSNIIENKDLTMYFRNGSGYVVRIIGSDGKIVGAGENVTFNINGIFYTRQTNSEGYARLDINLPQGTYIITASYNDCRESNTITVLPTLVADDYTKKYGEEGAFKVKVLDGHGRALSGVSVSFNINGVFYNKISDSNGFAKLNINLMPGKYIITSSYNMLSISNTVTVVP